MCIRLMCYAVAAFQFKHPQSELTSGMGRRSEDKCIKEWAAYFKTKPEVVRSGWKQYKSDPTNKDFTDYFKKCDNSGYFERMHKPIDKGRWIYHNREYDLIFNEDAVLTMRWEMSMAKKPIFKVRVIVID